MRGVAGVDSVPGDQDWGSGIMPDRHLVQAAGLLVALALAIVAVITVIKWAPAWLASDDGLTAAERAEDVGRVRTALLASLAGLIAVIGAYYTSRTFALNRKGQITERFTRAIDQLGNAVLDVRLGGIYTLARLARESREDYGPIMEILAAYVRDHAPVKVRGVEGDAETQENLTKPSTDVQAALAILVHRSVDRGTGPAPDLSFTSLPGVPLQGAHLEGANLKGAYLPDADLSYAHLQKAMLHGANLEKARNRKTADLNGATYGVRRGYGADPRSRPAGHRVSSAAGRAGGARSCRHAADARGHRAHRGEHLQRWLRHHVAVHLRGRARRQAPP